ncbi:MAG: hypothetical protein Q7V63_06120 [Gammaproteobacteria bacterium]|nr:hypothetical protein [Gammaproteobacteria bacterium]
MLKVPTIIRRSIQECIAVLPNNTDLDHGRTHDAVAHIDPDAATVNVGYGSPARTSLVIAESFGLQTPPRKTAETKRETSAKLLTTKACRDHLNGPGK